MTPERTIDLQALWAAQEERMRTDPVHAARVRELIQASETWYARHPEERDPAHVTWRGAWHRLQHVLGDEELRGASEAGIDLQALYWHLSRIYPEQLQG